MVLGKTLIKTLSCLLLFFASNASAQDAEIVKPDSIKKEIVAREINTTLTVDGFLREAEWQMAPPAPRFIQIEPLQGRFAWNPRL